MKLTNQKGIPWKEMKQGKEKPLLTFDQVQGRSLYVGVSLDYSYYNVKDCVVVMYKDNRHWKVQTNGSEDAFDFLDRNIRYFSQNRYQKSTNLFLKDYIIITTDACLSAPVRPEYTRRDIDLEKDRQQNWNVNSYLKITDWINRLPFSGASKRVYLETTMTHNYPLEVIGDLEKEIVYVNDVLKTLIEKPDPADMKGVSTVLLKDDYFRNAFVSMLVSVAYTRWKSIDKSGGEDFLEVTVDHDGVYWHLNSELLQKGKK